MNISRFIANRIQDTKTSTFTATVIKIGISSIAIGLAVMIISFSILVGFKETIKEKLFSLSSHIQISKITLNQSFEEIPMPISTKFYEDSKKNSSIRHIQAIANKAGLLKSEEEHTGIVIKGIGKDFDWGIFNENLIEGRKINFQDTTYANEIIISKTIAQKLNIKIKQSVTIYFIQNPPRIRKLTVVGIYDTGLEEFDKNFILADLALIQKINGWNANTAGHYEVFVKKFDSLETTANQLFNNMGHDMQLHTVMELYPPIFDWLNLMDRNSFVLIVLILVVASFNMISVLLVMMMERTPMIGLLKALGSNNLAIRQIFIYNGLNIIIKGIIYGNIIGIGFCLLQHYLKLIPLDAESYYMNYVPISINWSIILLLNIITILLVLAVITIPTFVVSKMKIIDSLKFKS